MTNNFFDKFLKNGSTVMNNTILLNLKKLNLTSEEFLIYSILEMYGQRGNNFPMPSQIESITGIEQNKIFGLIQNLIQKRIIEMKTIINKNHQQQDVYDITPVYSLLEKIVNDDTQKEVQNNIENSKQELFKMIEVEFGRPLSPIEQETIHSWIEEDNYSIDLIKLSLKEAVLNQAYSLKYMDRILINWEKQNIKTPEQLQERKNRGEF